jgi:hypothetical protein
LPAEIDTSLTPVAVRQALHAFMNAAEADIPEDCFQGLSETLPWASPVDALVQAMERIYRASTEAAVLPEALLRLCAQAAFHIYSEGWYAKGDRAQAIYQVCRRHLGLTADASTPDPETDPAPL